MQHDDIPMIMEREMAAPDYVAAMAVGFGYMPMEDGKASRKAGYPVFKDVIFFKCVTPGDTKSVHFQPVKESDKQRFPRAWAAFKERDSKPEQGMPIEQWPQVTRAQALTLRAMHIHTVEALAEVNDAHLSNMGRQWAEMAAKAKAFVLQAKDTAVSAKYAAENQELRDMISDLRQQMSRLSSEGEARRGPGRPRKEETQAA